MTAPLPRGTERVLVVDDDPDVRSSVSRMLERLGYEVSRASGPAGARKALDELEPDVVVMDVILPAMSGIALAHALSTLRPSLRFVYMSGYTTREVLGEGALEGKTVRFLRKPITIDALAEALRDVLETPGLPGPVISRSGEGPEAILVVDDDPDARRSIARSLSRLGYEMREADGPDAALRTILDGPVDLVVMDVDLPKLSGLALAHTISALRPGVRVLYISGHARNEVEGELGSGQDLEAPGVGFLRKPFGAEELAPAIRELLDDSSG